MTKHPDLPPKRIAGISHGVGAIAHSAAAGPQKRGEDGNERGLTGAIGPEQPEDFALLRLQCDVRQRPPATVVPRDVIDMDRVEVDTHDRFTPGGGPERSTQTTDPRR